MNRIDKKKLAKNKMASIAEILCNFISEAKVNHEDDISDQNMNDKTRMILEGQLGQKEIKRSMNVGMYKILQFLRDDASWQTKQARRKFEKEDIINKNPGFDPIFMKV